MGGLANAAFPDMQVTIQPAQGGSASTDSRL